MRKPLPPLPNEKPVSPQPSTGDNEPSFLGVRAKASPQSQPPLVERFAKQTPASPGPEESAGTAAVKDELQRSDADWALVSEVERRRKQMDDLLKSIHDDGGRQSMIPASTEDGGRQRAVDVEPIPTAAMEQEDEEALEQRRRWVEEHGKAWSRERYEQRLAEKAQRIAHESDEDRKGAVLLEEVRQRLENASMDEIVADEEDEDKESESEEESERLTRRGRVMNEAEVDDEDAGTSTDKTEEEELKDEIEQSMKNDKEKIKEQMENLRKYQAASPKKAGSGWGATRRRSLMFSLHGKKAEPTLTDKDVQAELNKLLSYLKNMKVETLANSQSRKVIAMSGGLNVPQAYDFMERHGISSAPVYDEEGRTVGTIDSSDLMAFILISERPSFLQEVLRSTYDKDPFTKPVSAMIGASGRNQFTMVRAVDTVYSLLQVFSLGRPSACVLDHEDMISWVVSQSSLLAYIDEYLNSAGVHLGRAQIVDLNVIVSKIPFVRETVKAGEAFVSLCIHQAQAAAVIDEKRHLIAEISSRCFRGLTKFTSAEFYLPIGTYMSEVHKASPKGWDEAVTCRATITFRELLNLIVTRKAHRVWVVEGRKNRVVGLITLTSIIRSLLGVGCLYDQKPPIQGKLGPAYFDITNPDQWPHLRNK
jgi:CBS-domain-containing membrane protein